MVSTGRSARTSDRFTLSGFFQEGSLNFKVSSTRHEEDRKQLDRLYGMLEPKFEGRFSPKFRAVPFARGGAV